MEVRYVNQIVHQMRKLNTIANSVPKVLRAKMLINSSKLNS